MARPAVTFRPVAPDDGEALCRVHRAAILTLGRGAYSAEEVQSWVHGLTPESERDAMRDESQIAEVALDDAGRIVAFCYTLEDEVKALYVHPDAAGQGLGRRFMERAESRMAEAGFRQVRVEASASGRPFYERLGYRVTQAFDFPSRGGLAMKAFRMIRELPSRDPSAT